MTTHLRTGPYLRSVRCTVCNGTHASKADTSHQATARAHTEALQVGWVQLPQRGTWFCADCAAEIREAMP